MLQMEFYLQQNLGLVPHFEIHTDEYDEITFLLNIVSLFLVTYQASSEYIHIVNKYIWVEFGTDIHFFVKTFDCKNWWKPKLFLLIV